MVLTLTTCSGGERRRVNLRPGGGLLMVLEWPNITELRVDSTGFFGESLQFTKGSIPRREYLACCMGYCIFGAM